MRRSKKLLIISCSTGSGHGRAAEALKLACHRLHPDTQSLHIDFADYASWLARVSIINSYSFFISRAPKLFGIVYRLSDNAFTQKFFVAGKSFFRLGVKKIINKIKDYQPDYIISTHFLPQLILPKNFSVPIDVVITDYYAHHIWLAPNARNFFVASEEVKNDLEKLKIKSIASGLPVHPRFLKQKEKELLKKQFGIENNWPTVLLMPVYKGVISAKEAVNAIFSNIKEVNVVAISGKNNGAAFKNLSEIKSSGQKNLIILKNTGNVDDWMRIADIIVSKAGGLTITEAIYMQKPIVVVNPIPGQEEYNASYLEQNGYGCKAKSINELVEKIQMLLSEPEIIKKSPPNNAAETILNVVLG